MQQSSSGPETPLWPSVRGTKPRAPRADPSTSAARHDVARDLTARAARMVGPGHAAMDAGQPRRHFDDVRMDTQPSGVRARASPRVELPSPNGRVPSSRARATLPDIGYELADHRQPTGEAAGDEEKPLRLHAAYGRLRLMRRLSLSAATVATGGQTNGHPPRSEALGCPRYGWDGCGQRYKLVMRLTREVKHPKRAARAHSQRRFQTVHS